MSHSEWLLVALSTIKSQSNTLTVQPRREGRPGNQMITDWLAPGRSYQSLQSRYLKVLRPKWLESRGRLPRRTHQPMLESTSEEEEGMKERTTRKRLKERKKVKTKRRR